MTSIKEALKIIQRTIKGDQIEAAVVDVGTMMPLGKVVSDALAQLDRADAKERIARIINAEVGSKADPNFVERRWLTGVGRAADAILSTGLLPDAGPGNGAGLPGNLSDIIEKELMTWRGANGGVYTIHAAAIGVSIAIRAALHSTSAAGETRYAEQALNEQGNLGKGLPNDPDNVPKNENIVRAGS